MVVDTIVNELRTPLDNDDLPAASVFDVRYTLQSSRPNPSVFCDLNDRSW